MGAYIHSHVCSCGLGNQSKVNSRTCDLRVVIKYKWWSNPIRVCIFPGWCGGMSSGSMRQMLAHASPLSFLSPSCLLKSVSHTCQVPSPLPQGCRWLAMIEKFLLLFIALPKSAVNQTQENSPCHPQKGSERNQESGRAPEKCWGEVSRNSCGHRV